MTGRNENILIVALGTTQTIAWASSYYLPAILAEPIARDLQISNNWVFAAFSAALIISGLLGPRIGRQIDRLGGREVLCASNFVLAAGLVALGVAQSPAIMAIAWMILGVGMGLGLYDSAFATLGRIYGDRARRSITGITLLAGFASTIGWPLSAWGLGTFGWRSTCFGWAAVHLLICLPLNGIFIPRLEAERLISADAPKPHIPIDRAMILLAFAFAAAWSVTSAMAVHLLQILEALGATPVQAVAAGALIGPAQVAARIFEASLLKRFHPLWSARLACVTHPPGACVIGLFGGGFAGVFALLHGAGNGVLTIARGTLPLAIFGPKDYGYRLGLLGAPSRLSQAIAPVVFGFLILPLGGYTLVVTSALSLAALLALSALPAVARADVR